jgi:hypothetical protein
MFGRTEARRKIREKEGRSIKKEMPHRFLGRYV